MKIFLGMPKKILSPFQQQYKSRQDSSEVYQFNQLLTFLFDIFIINILLRNINACT